MAQPLTIQIHASCVELSGLGVLLRGASGSGKSDLALRLIEAGARLVADDRTDLAIADGALVASSPATIAGRLEIRGVGIVDLPSVAMTRVGLAADLVAPAEIERLPAPRHCAYLGIEIPLIAVTPFECSAAAKLRVAAREAARGRLPAV
jgi:HPr kinase/phosphorylase